MGEGYKLKVMMTGIKKANDISLKKRERLDDLYRSYNHRRYVHPDPLEFLYGYPDVRDRELVALISSSLAYGRVAQILKSVAQILRKMDNRPWSFLLNTSKGAILKLFADFKHRFTTGEEMAFMLLGAKRIIESFGSIHECFMAGFHDDQDSILSGLSYLVRELGNTVPEMKNSLLPLPSGGSACKRWNLFLRWMIRKDSIDPGGWAGVHPSKLIIPLDTHMHNICLRLNITNRKQADMRTALQITDAFREIAPHDPVRYDFALTRLGIRKDADLESFLSRC